MVKEIQKASGYQLQRVVQDCPWIAPCPFCGAVCQVTVESGTSENDKSMAIKVDYACARKHPPKASG